MLKLIASKRGVGPLTPQFIVLYVLAAIVTLIFYLVLQGYTAQSVPALIIENEKEINQDYLADILLTLPNWNDEQMCLAKSEETSSGEIIYPGLVPEWKLDEMRDAGRTDLGGTRMCVTMPNKNRNLDWGAIISDMENGNSWNLNTAETSADGKASVERLLAIEYPTGIVHVGRLQLWICKGSCA